MRAQIERLGGSALYLVQDLGRMGIFLGLAVGAIFKRPFRLGEVIRQARLIGANSFFVIFFTAAFTGMVLGLQGYYTLRKFGAEGALGSAVALSLIRELGPVLTALMVIGRAGSAMCAEIGIMRNSEQLDALECMAVDPFRYLIAPKLVAHPDLDPPADPDLQRGGDLRRLCGRGDHAGGQRRLLLFRDGAERGRCRYPDGDNQIPGFCLVGGLDLHRPGLLCPYYPGGRFRGRGGQPGDHPGGGFFLNRRAGLGLSLNGGAVVNGPIIQFAQVGKSFGTQSVLAGVDFSIFPGRTTVIAGASGQGKSVTLKLILGLLKADSGRVLVKGRDIARIRGRELNELRMNFGVLFQGAALLDSLTVFANVALPLEERTRLAAAEIRNKVLETLEQLGLAGHEDKYPAQLSGGMKKRVGLARALMLQPEIMLFDEPTTGLDPEKSLEIYRLFLETQQKFGYTSVIVSHDLPKIFNLADQVIIMGAGKAKSFAGPEDIQRSSDPDIREFVRITMGNIYTSRGLENGS